MKTYTLSLTEHELRLMMYLLDDITTGLRQRLDEAADANPTVRGVALSAMAHPATRTTYSRKKSIQVTHGEAVQKLTESAHVAEATALDHWRNKSGTKFGWDRWFKTYHGEAAQLLWPEWKAGGR